MTMRNVKATLKNRSRPTKDGFGRDLGFRHATFYEWYPIRKPLKERGGEPVLDEYGYPDYRRRSYKYINGVRGKLLPLSYKQGRRPDEGPRGGRGYQYFHYKLYMVELNGPRICRYRHELVDFDEDTHESLYVDYWEPFTGSVYGIDGCTSDLVLQDGLVVIDRKAA